MRQKNARKLIYLNFEGLFSMFEIDFFWKSGPSRS